jgi:hypothetical protein
MHLRLSTATRNGKTHSYAQLVESYRRPDGVPAHRVVAHLGQLSTTEIENFKAALAANRQGRHVVVARAPARAPRRPTANLRYLDLAVLLALWRDSGLDRLLSTLLPKGASDVAPADVVAALALERCVDPGSKLYAEPDKEQLALLRKLRLQILADDDDLAARITPRVNAEPENAEASS